MMNNCVNENLDTERIQLVVLNNESNQNTHNSEDNAENLESAQDGPFTGTLKFDGFRKMRKNSKAKFVVVNSSIDTQEDAWNTLINKWKTPAPKIIISINGGAKNMVTIPNKLNTAFKKGLMKVSSAACTWLISTGFDTGVSKLVGEAVREYHMATTEDNDSLVAIGISTFGSVTHYDKIRYVKEKAERDTVINYHDTVAQKGLAVLNPHYSHLILYDDGTEKTFNGEIQFRVEFEDYVSKMIGRVRDISENRDGERETMVALDVENEVIYGTPMVQLVIEGDKKTIETTYVAVQRGIPTILLKGSGRCADLLCELLEITTEYSLEREVNATAEELLKREEENWGLTEREIEMYANQMKLMTKKSCRKFLKIFNVDDVGNKLDQAILKAVFENSKLSAEMQLSLALDMNRCDVASSQLFHNDRPNEWKPEQLIEPMMIALKKGQTEFVNLFIDYGINIRDFLTDEKLKQLYGYAQKHPNNRTISLQPIVAHVQSNWWSPFKLCSSQTAERAKENKEKKKLKAIGKILNVFTGDLIPNPYDDTYENSRNIYERSGANVIRYPPISELGSRMYTEQDLFYWALLMNNMDLAITFWRIGKDHIGAALIACGIFKHMQNEALRDGELELAGVLEENSRYFELLATAVLTKAHEQDKERSHKLLFRGLPYYGDETPLALADQNVCLDFMSHSAVQTKMSSIWMGHMCVNLPTWKILLNLVIPFVFIRLIFPWKVKRKLKPKLAKVMETENVDGIEEDYLNDSHRESNEKQTKWVYVPWHMAIWFFFKAPVVKFAMSTFSSIAFLAMLCFLTLVDLAPCSNRMPNSKNMTIVNDFDVFMAGRCISIFELITWFWMLTLIMEEIRQIAAYEQKTLYYKVSDWIASGWNKFDLVIYLICVSIIIVRFITDETGFQVVRYLYAAMMSLFFLRFMQTYYVNRTIGPKIVMIATMMGDLAFFLLIFIIYILAYGTAAQALLHPNSKFNFALLKNIVYRPYFQSFGELSLEIPEKNVVVIAFFSLYLLLTNILLMNLLIAMFGYTFQNIQNQSLKIWAYKRHDLVFEFVDRPFLPPPFIILPIMRRFFRGILYKLQIDFLCCKRTKSKTQSHRKPRKVILEPDSNRKMSAFEKHCAELVMTAVQASERVRDPDALQNIINGSRVKFDDDFKIEDDDENLDLKDEIMNKLDKIEDAIKNYRRRESSMLLSMR